MSLNVCSLSLEALEHLLDNISCEHSWDIPLLQEVSSISACGPLHPDLLEVVNVNPELLVQSHLLNISGHSVLLGNTPWRCCGVVINRAHMNAIVSQDSDELPSAVLSKPDGTFYFISAHLPNVSHGPEAYTQSCVRLHDTYYLSSFLDL